MEGLATVELFDFGREEAFAFDFVKGENCCGEDDPYGKWIRGRGFDIWFGVRMARGKGEVSSGGQEEGAEGDGRRGDKGERSCAIGIKSVDVDSRGQENGKGLFEVVGVVVMVIGASGPINGGGGPCMNGLASVAVDGLSVEACG